MFRDLRKSADFEKLKFSEKTNETLYIGPGDVNGNPFSLVNLNVGLNLPGLNLFIA